ncbi:MAG: uncharacterized protein QG652_604 [Pseudomonadota bacterium]|nr:uncharacterized protein [Pseudomonadota bacterium]
MPHLNEKTYLTLWLVLSLTLFSPVQAAEDTTTSIFRFQQTMAQKGHAPAQYNLAMMYETGNGIAQDPEAARTWYTQAANQSYKPASRRLTYLDIVGTRSKADRSWLMQVHKDAQSGDGEAMLLLGQMYATGSGVTQELNVASRYLRKAVADNIPGSENELAQVEKTIRQKQADELARKKQQAEADKKLAQQKADARTAEQARIKRILMQKQLADAKALQQQQALAAQQETAAEKPVTSVITPALAAVEVKTPPANTTDAEVDLSPCRGRNRFAATCR